MLGAYIRTIDLILPADILKPLCNAIAMCCYPSSYRVKRPFDVEMNWLVTFATHFAFPPSVGLPPCYSQRIFTSPSPSRQPLSPLQTSTRRCLPNASAKQASQNL